MKLQAAIDSIKTINNDIAAAKTEKMGVEIMVADLEAQIMTLEMDEDQRKMKQDAYKVEVDKLKGLNDKMYNLEMKLLEVMEERKEAESQLAGTGITTTTSSSVQGGQISAIPSYDGTPGAEAEKWVRMIDRFKENFNWSSNQTAQTVRNKLTGEAALFVDNQDDEGIPHTDTWDEGDLNLRQMLLQKFGPTLSESTSSHAVDDLQQGANELVDPFYERVRYAVTQFLYGMKRANNFDRAAYSRIYGRLVYNFFKAGIYSTYRQRIFNGAANTHPKTHGDLLTAARAVELEAGKSKKDNIKQVSETSVEGVDENQVVAEGTEEESKLSVEFAAMKKEVEAIRVQWQNRRRGGRRGGGRGFRGRGFRPFGGRGNGNWNAGGQGRGGRNDGCHNCGEMGHWVRQCPYMQGGQQRGGRRPFRRGAPRYNNEMHYQDYNNDYQGEASGEGFYEGFPYSGYEALNFPGDR